MHCPELAKRLAHHHPDENDVSLPERCDFLLAQRVHAGTISFSLRKSARDQRVIDAPGPFQLIIVEIGAQDAKRLHV